VGSLAREDDGSPPPLIGRTERVREFIEDSHVNEDERGGVARSAMLVMFAKGGDPSPSPLGKGDDDDCASSCATVVKSDHCAASHVGDNRVGVDGSEVDIAVEVDSIADVTRE
jgi:hypothetical protein